MKCGVYEFSRLRWPIDVDHLIGRGSGESEEVIAEHVRKPKVVIGMKMGQEDGRNLLGLDARLNHALHSSNTAVDEVLATIDNQHCGRFRPIHMQRWAAARAEEENFGPRAWLRRGPTLRCCCSRKHLRGQND